MRNFKFLVNVCSVGALSLFLFTACQKDTNTYNYSDVENIKADGFESSYSAISGMDTLEIKLDVGSNIEQSEFDYVWAVYETNAQGYIPTFDTISREKDLFFPVDLPAKGYVLVSVVKNKKTGLSKYQSATLTVNTAYTRGWYVLKDDGSSSDLDHFLTPESIIPEDKNENIFSRINGFKLEGKGTRLTYASDFKTTVASTSPQNTKTLFMGTSKNVSAVFINTLEQIRDRKDIFFGGEAEGGKDMAVFISSSSLNILNNNQVYGIYNMAANSGVFGTSVMRDDYNSPYKLSPYFFTDYSMNPIFFDETSSSFVASGPAASVFTRISDKEGTELPANNNNKTALYMAFQRSEYDPVNYKYNFMGVGLFQDKNDESLKIITRLLPEGYNMFIECDTVEVSDKIANSSLHSALVSTIRIGAENLLYFVHDGKDVYSRNLSNGTERLQFSVPGGEKVTFIRHRSYTEGGYAFDFVMIGTEVGGRYKIRMFEKSNGNLLSEPKFILEGEGSARDVMYVSPSVGNNTYPTGY